MNEPTLNSPHPHCLRSLLFAALIAWSTFVGPTRAQPASASDRPPPNVVFVLTDDQGYGDLSFTGNPVLQTPQLDRLARQSLRLTDYHVSPTCAPTRGALMSGHFSNRAGTWHTINGRSLLREGEATLGEVFAANGYATGLFGKWHLGDNYPFRPEDRGFQEVVRHGGGGVGQTPDHWNNGYFDDIYLHNGVKQAYSGYCTEVFFREAKRFIDECHAAGRPFLTYIATNAPHSPFHSPESYRRPYTALGLSEKQASFFGMLASIDHEIGALRDHLDQLGIADNTVFVFTTDNGTAGGRDVFNAGMRGAKTSAYDGGHRVPFFLHWPAAGLDQGRDIDQLTAHVDVLPTLIELCGLHGLGDYRFDGRSLVPLLFNLPVTWPDRVIVTDSQRIVMPRKWRNSSVMTEQWRLINGEELYAITADPGQQKDLAARRPEIVRELRAAYDAWWDDVSTDFDTYARIRLGNDADNPTRLTCHDWINGNTGIPWNQGLIRTAYPTTGHWPVRVEQPGWYEIELRRWPEEAHLPISAGAPTGPPSPGAEAFRVTPGVALPITAATLMIGDLVEHQPVAAGDEAVRFRVRLPAGDHDLRCDFEFADSTRPPIGAYYVKVERQ